jgi:uncharacterized protein YrrD
VRRGLDVVGSNVMDVESGEVIGVVRDLLFDREGRLQGILLEKKHWFEQHPFLPIAAIQSIGEDWLMAQQNGQGNPGSQVQLLHLLKGDQSMVGQPVVTSKGKQLGILEDVYLEQDSGTIVGYELSDGFFADLMEGRRLIEPPSKFMFGKDAFVVHEADEASLLSTEGSGY